MSEQDYSKNALANFTHEAATVLWRERLFINEEGESQGKGRRLAAFLAEKCAETERTSRPVTMIRK